MNQDSAVYFNREDSEAIRLLANEKAGFINDKVEAFEKTLPELEKKLKMVETLRKSFVEDYTMQRILNMTKEEYVMGLEKNTFCNRLENELKELGDIHGPTSTKFGLYYGKSGDDTEKKYRTTKGKFGDDPDEALAMIKEEIIHLRMDGEKHNLDGIRKCKLPDTVKGKILHIYFPDQYLPIYGEEHINHFLSCLDISHDKDDDILTKQQKLIDWRNSNSFSYKWDLQTLMRFFYFAFGRPQDEKKRLDDLQKERDKAYPRKYVTHVNISKEDWKMLLRDDEVFKEKDLHLVKKIYLSDNHATTCYDLAIKDGKNPSAYLTPVVRLAMRVSEKMNLDPIIIDKKQVWWRILFWGSYVEDNHFEWKLQPKLAKAIREVFPEWDTNEVNTEADTAYVNDLREVAFQEAEQGFEYTGMPKAKDVPVFAKGQKVYPRDRKTAMNALAHACYKCEVDANHPTFIRKKSDIPYTEPHHLVPISCSDQFEVSLDVEENIVSLCSNCHNQIHYGKNADEILKSLYEARKKDLEKVGIRISLSALLKIYG